MTTYGAAIPRIMLAAAFSGSGKTTLTCGLLEVFRRRSLDCVSFKVGPDYIDPMFHQQVLGIPSHNLDSFFLEKEPLLDLVKRASAGHQLAVMEGVMGYYDGVAGISTKASSYEIAQMTHTPVILVIDGKKSSLSLAALLKGFLQYREDSGICGVILNRVSPSMGERLRPFLEELGITFLGVVPEWEDANWESRHLGLMLPEEQKGLQEKISRFADQLEQSLFVEKILGLARQAPPMPGGSPLIKSIKKISPYRMGIAQDAAFCFYYPENLSFLESIGCQLLPFSPLLDQQLPERLDGILLGGGYPELYAEELSQNQKMLEAIRIGIFGGMQVLAECGGFLYLHESLEDANKTPYPMAGVIPGRGYQTSRLSRFGYITLQGRWGEIRGHEFHYWESTNPGSQMKALKPCSARSWECMHVDRQMIAGFPHLYYPSSPELIVNFLQKGDPSCYC